MVTLVIVSRLSALYEITYPYLEICKDYFLCEPFEKIVNNLQSFKKSFEIEFNINDY